MYYKIYHNKEAREEVVRGLKPRRKVRITHFKVKITVAGFVIVSKFYE